MRQLIGLLGASLIAVGAAGCASTQATMMSKNVVKIDASSAPVCAGKTNEIMMHRAGIETIRRGYDRYVLLDHGTASVATGIDRYGHINRAGKGAVIVKMFKEGEPGSENALSARELLGPDWQKIVEKGEKTTCL